METIMNNDDPRLTAYALGELDASERPAVEAFLERSAEARTLVEETRALAGVLSEQLAGEPGPGLTNDQHRALDQALAGEGRGSVGTVLQLRLWLPAVAALLLIGVVTWQLGLIDGLDPRGPVTGAGVADGGVESKDRFLDCFVSLGYTDGADRQAVLSSEALGELDAFGYVDDSPSQSLSRKQDAPPTSGTPFTYELWGDDKPIDVDVVSRRSRRNSSYPLAKAGPAPLPAGEPESQNLTLNDGRRAEADLSALGRAKAESPEAAAQVEFRKEWVEFVDKDSGRFGYKAGQRDEVGGPRRSGGNGGRRRGGSHGGQYRGPPGAGVSGVAPPTNPGGADAAGQGSMAGGQGGGGSRADSARDLAFYSANGFSAVGGSDPATPVLETVGDDGDGLEFGKKAQQKPKRSAVAKKSAGAAPASSPAADVSGGSGALTGKGRVARGESSGRAHNFGMPPASSIRKELEALGYLAAAPKPVEPASEDADDRLRELGYFGDRSDDREAPSYRRRRESGGESYAAIHENPFVPLTSDPLSRLSTFGVDVDTASYANVRRYLNMGQAPPANAVRLEELVNYFRYDDPAPGDDDEVPFAVSVESAAAPWAPSHRLVRVALKGAEHLVEDRPASNLVFLLDVSGSMKSSDKLPLLVASLKLLLEELDGDDKVAIVTYASGTRLVLPSTSCSDKPTILSALDRLTAGGSTHASAGIQQAYEVAAEGFISGGVNRVLLATDGDFNVGITQEGDLEHFIEDKARGGVFLTVLGFGTGNLKDSKAEILADRGNGNYAYIDTLNEAYKVLVRELGATLITIAKDVKIQVEFNPAKVAAYRQLGYENRALAAADFRDDRKDAGEIGAGHSVIALYEIVPVGVGGVPGTADLRYGQTPEPVLSTLIDSPELLTVNLRYKLPDESTSSGFAVPFVDAETGFTEASDDFRFSAAVASFGMVLRHSSYRGSVTLGGIASVADAARGPDPDGYRSEFVRLVRIAQGLPGY